MDGISNSTRCIPRKRMHTELIVVRAESETDNKNIARS